MRLKPLSVEERQPLNENALHRDHILGVHAIGSQVRPRREGTRRE
jgi:hypothetical protein